MPPNRLANGLALLRTVGLDFVPDHLSWVSARVVKDGSPMFAQKWSMEGPGKLEIQNYEPLAIQKRTSPPGLPCIAGDFSSNVGGSMW